MSTTITLLNDLGSSIKQLHDNMKTVHGLPTTIKSAGKVADQLRTVIVACLTPTTPHAQLPLTGYSIIPSVMPVDHDYAWCLGTMKLSIGSFITVATRICNSQAHNITDEEERNTTTAKQATDLHIAVRVILVSRTFCPTLYLFRLTSDIRDMNSLNIRYAYCLQSAKSMCW
jgi:hypothetical protein